MLFLQLIAALYLIAISHLVISHSRRVDQNVGANSRLIPDDVRPHHKQAVPAYLYQNQTQVRQNECVCQLEEK